MELFFDVGLLLGIRPFNNDIPKTELRQVTPEDKTPQTHIISIHPTMNTAFDGIHHIKGTIVAYIVQFLQTVKIQQVDIIIFEGHDYAQRVRNGVIGLLHNHILQLAHQVILLRLTGICRHHTANDDIRMKILPHHIRREIIVNAAIISKRTVYFYRFEDKWKAHGSTYRISQIPFTQYQWLFIVHIGCYTAKRNKQFVEITATCSRSTCKQFHKYQVHLYGVDHACGKYLGLYMQRVPKSKTDIKKFR